MFSHFLGFDFFTGFDFFVTFETVDFLTFFTATGSCFSCNIIATPTTQSETAVINASHVNEASRYPKGISTITAIMNEIRNNAL